MSRIEPDALQLKHMYAFADAFLSMPRLGRWKRIAAGRSNDWAQLSVKDVTKSWHGRPERCKEWTRGFDELREHPRMRHWLRKQVVVLYVGEDGFRPPRTAPLNEVLGDPDVLEAVISIDPGKLALTWSADRRLFVCDTASRHLADDCG